MVAASFKSGGIQLIERPPAVAASNRELLGVVQWVDRALGALVPRLNEPSESRFVVLTEEPKKPRRGQLVYADGTYWDPGSGEGLYTYNGFAWIPVGYATLYGGLTEWQALLDTGVTSAFAPPGTYDLSGGTLVLPSTLKYLWAIPGTVTLIEATITATGTVGSEVDLDAAVAAGDTSLPFTTSGFAAGDWLHVASCINAASADAGDYQLGWPTAGSDGLYFAEFAQIREIVDGTEATAVRDMIFPYSDTPGGDSGARTASTVKKVTFIDGLVISGFNFQDKGLANDLITLKWCRDTWVEHCTFTFDMTDNVIGQMVEADRCLGGGVRHCVGRRYGYDGVEAGSSVGSIHTRGCQDFSVIHNDLAGGGTPVDITWFATDLPNAFPSVNCIVDHNILRNSETACTIHNCCYGGSMSFNTVEDCSQGVRVRTRKTKVIGNDISKGGNAVGFGINAATGWLDGCVIANNVIRGFLYGIEVDGDNSEGEPPAPGRLVIIGNNITDSSDGINIDRTEATDVSMAVLVANNYISRYAERGIFVGSYCNGTTLNGNMIGDPVTATSAAAIEWEKNIAHLTIMNTVMFNMASELTLVGPGTATCIDDLTTFPGGNADAYWAFVNNVVQGTTFNDSDIVQDQAAYSDLVKSRGYNITQGVIRVQQITGVTGSLLQVVDSSNNIDFAVDQDGKLLGTNPAAAKAAIAAAATLADLKTALAILFQ